MSKYWSKQVHKLEPYVPGEQPEGSGLVKLNTNENPFGPSPRVLAALSAGITDKLRLYPDPVCRHLRETIACYHAVLPERVFVGNGSDEILAHLFNALFQHNKPVLFPDISYSFYPVYCRLYDIEYQPIPLDRDFQINVKDYAVSNGGVILPNPNAPTGVLLDLAQIEELAASCPDSVVAIDEAYIDFGGRSAIALVDRYPNLLVIQTLSKSRSLAGLRVGFAVGQPDLIEALVRVKDSFNSYPLDTLAQMGAVAALKDEDYFKRICQKVIANRQSLTKGLQERGFEVLPSAANFVFARHSSMLAGEIFEGLRTRGVYVRYFNKPRIDQYLRISVGTQEQQSALLASLDDLLN